MRVELRASRREPLGVLAGILAALRLGVQPSGDAHGRRGEALAEISRIDRPGLDEVAHRRELAKAVEGRLFLVVGESADKGCRFEVKISVDDADRAVQPFDLVASSQCSEFLLYDQTSRLLALVKGPVARRTTNAPSGWWAAYRPGAPQAFVLGHWARSTAQR